jgi:hypothetical protein
MGLEARCEIRYRPADGDERVGEGAVHLDDAELLVRGVARHRIPRASITCVEARGDGLIVMHAGGTSTFALGATSAKWAARLAAPPRPVVDKLDIRAGMQVSAVGVPDAALLADVAARAGALTRGRIAAGSDVALVGVHEPAHLARLATAAARLAPGGCLWVLHPRGVPAVADTAIFAAAAACGLVATKVARVSDELSGEKLVHRKGARSGGGGGRCEVFPPPRTSRRPAPTPTFAPGRRGAVGTSEVAGTSALPPRPSRPRPTGVVARLFPH